MQRRYGYSEKNKRAFGETKLGRSKRVNTIAGLTTKGIVARYSFVGTLTGKLFFKYVKDYLLPVLTSESVVVLDNAKAHYNKEALKLIKSKGAKIIFLPPYSPDLNPIEKFWAKFKNYLRIFSAQTIDELFIHINNFFDTFKFESGLNYFLSCGYWCILLFWHLLYYGKMQFFLDKTLNFFTTKKINDKILFFRWFMLLNHNVEINKEIYHKGIFFCVFL